MHSTNSKVDDYLAKISSWQEELAQLRKILLDCGLTEEFKWGVPCYMFQKSNVVLLGSFKEYCVISFVKGALLNDADGILIQQTENSQAVRIIRFTNIREIIALKTSLKAYIFEAIEVEKAGLKVPYEKSKNLVLAQELEDKLAESPALKTAFEALTPGRQRAYNIYFSAPKQTRSRESRIEKYRQRILDGKGINDCVCGFSKRMPSCDGSHKYLQQEN